MARVRVKMFATVREAAQMSECTAEAATLRQLLDSLKTRFGPQFAKIVDQAMSDPERLVILVNGQNSGFAASGSTPLRDGDEVALFPPVSGG